jgi:hypothetical protein
MKLSIKGYKKIAGHDGQGFTCTLYVNGARAASYFDDGWGGEVSVSQMFDRALHDKALEFVAAIPEYVTSYTHGGETLTHTSKLSLPYLLSLMAEEAEMVLWLKRGQKRDTVTMFTEDITNSEWRTCAEFDSPALRAYFNKQYGCELVFANDYIENFAQYRKQLYDIAW